MKSQNLGTLSSATTGTAFQSGTSPLIQGNQVVGVIHTSADFAGAAKLQTSDDNSSWTDVSGGSIAAAGSKYVTFTLGKYNRLNCTSRSAGSVTADLLG